MKRYKCTNKYQSIDKKILKYCQYIDVRHVRYVVIFRFHYGTIDTMNDIDYSGQGPTISIPLWYD